MLLAIPLAGLLAVTGYGVYLGATQSREASRLQERTDLALSSYQLVDALQAERAALIADKASTAELRTAVDESASTLTARAAALGGELQVATERAVRRVDAAQRVSGNELGGRVALAAYSSAIEYLLDLSTDAIDTGASVDNGPASTTDYLARAHEASAQERDLTVIASDEGLLDAASFQALMALASAQESYTSLAAASAPDELGLLIEGIGYSMSAADSIRRDVFTTPEGRDYTTWIAGLEQRTDALEEMQQVAEVQAVAAVDDFATWSRQLFLAAAIAAILIIAVSALLLRRAVRSIARPLQDLAAQAEEVATTRLPEAVKAQQDHGGEELHLPALRATGAAEVHEVAAAFNDVQDTALRLASEQAALRVNQAEAMTNLGRRNQTLLARQLDFITSLETRETDPAFLEHLFKLDHLASRMRRNAESLLILAGSETPRRRRAPAPVAEVVRAAMSEVEEFERVRIGHLLEATLSGPVVIDLIHLLAELIENALGFSPPDTTVEIDGRSLGQGGYQLAVIDHGVGMSDVELLAANQRISGLDELEGMPTRYLGQYVVAKLAAKTGTHVRLQPSSGGRGVTAIVTLATAAVTSTPGRPAVAAPMPGSRASREQGPTPFAPGAGVQTSTARQDDAPVEPLETTGREAISFDTPSFDAGSFDAGSFDTPSFETGSERATVADSSEPTPYDFEVGLNGFGGDAPAAAAFEVPEYELDSFELDSFEPTDAAAEDASAASATFDPAAFDIAAPDAPPPLTPETVASPTAAPPTAAPPTVAPPIVAPPTVEYGNFDDAEQAAFQVEPIGPGESIETGDPVADEISSILEARPDDTVETPADLSSEEQWARFSTELPEPAAEAPFPAADPFADISPPAPAEPLRQEWMPAPEPVVEPTPEPALAAASPLAAAQEQFGAGRPGGLSKRVPGASLAESRKGDTASAPVEEADRSADAVRSMLSSFQAGRSRGRVGPDDAPTSDTSPAGTPVPTTPTTHDDADRVGQDGRSSQ